MRTDREPTRHELRAIEAEWPLIAAELVVVDAEIAAAVTGVEPGARRALLVSVGSLVGGVPRSGKSAAVEALAGLDLFGDAA